ncbi:MAG: DUF1289 domain-containing protein [Pseudomonadota bacterium]
MTTPDDSAALRRAVRPAEGAIETPCVQICVLHPETRLCVGCARTGDEIARWSRMSAEERRVVMAELPQREAGPRQRRGGRASVMRRRNEQPAREDG